MSDQKRTESTDSRFRHSSSVEYIAARWCTLPPHIREAIVTLVDAAIITTPSRTQVKGRDKAKGEA